MAGRLAPLGLAGTFVLALTLRSLDAPTVFWGEDVLLTIWDGSYHARRALYSFVHFPAVLTFDPYIAYPDGARVPMPPLFDWLLAGTARLFGDDVATFECVAAWFSPALAALTVVPVYAAARTVGTRGIGLTAAALFACLPASMLITRVGDPDHHAAVALLATTYAALSAAVTSPGIGARGRAALGAGLLVNRAALALCWSGSLLYLGIGEGALLVAAVLAGGSALAASQALGALGAALLLIPWLCAAGTPIGGPFSTITLSWLHPAFLLAVAAIAGALAWLERRAPLSGVAGRAARAVALVAVLAFVALTLPAVREALSRAVSFLAKGDSWAHRNVEQSPLFAWMPGGRSHSGWVLFGAWAYAIPLVPIALAWSSKRARQGVARVVLACWTAPLAAFALLQIRFANDLAPLGSVGFALLLDALRRPLARRLPGWAATAVVAAIALGMLWPAASAVYAPRIARLGGYLAHPDRRRDPALDLPGPALLRFAQRVRSATPETAGYLEPSRRPEYGILVKPSHGHVIHYAARRATPSNGFGPYLDPAKNDAVNRFFRVRSESAASAIASQLEARYVITFDRHGLGPGTFTHLLHRKDGAQEGGFVHTERFRLVVEAPRNSPTLPTSFPNGAPPGTVPYKLFEHVRGALLEAHAAPGVVFEVDLELETNTGRRFVYRAATRTGADGIGHLRVPYATAGGGPTHATGPYRVVIGDLVRSAHVRDDEVRRGARVALGY